MCERAAHLIDGVFVDVLVRQWVLTLPHLLRYRLAYDHRLCRAVLGVLARHCSSHTNLGVSRWPVSPLFFARDGIESVIQLVGRVALHRRHGVAVRVERDADPRVPEHHLHDVEGLTCRLQSARSLGRR